MGDRGKYFTKQALWSGLIDNPVMVTGVCRTQHGPELMQPQTPPAETSEQRGTGRFKTHALQSSVGVVLDISGGGMRVISNRVLSGEFDLSIYGYDDLVINTRVRVAWRSRLGFREHVVGLSFVDITPQLLQDIARLRQLDFKDNTRPRPRAPRKLGYLPWAMLGTGVVLSAVLINTDVHWTQTLGGGYGADALLPIAKRAGIIIGLILTSVALVLLIKAKNEATPRTRTAPDPPAPPNSANSSEMLVNAVLESSLGGIMVLDAVRSAQDQVIDFTVRRVNTAAEHILGKSSDLLIGQSLNTCLPCLHREPFYSDVISVLENWLPYQSERRLNHNQRWYKFAAVRLADGLVVTFEDTTQSQKNAEKLRRIANHDPLTGLPNRKFFLEQVDRALIRYKRYPDRPFAVLFLDFDRFKSINDTLGHEVGDQLLQSISEKLQLTLRASDVISQSGDKHLAARLGGDEFVVLLENIDDARDAEAVTARLVETFRLPHALKNNEVQSTSSIGMVISRPDHQSADDVLRDADTAMYIAKSTGKSRYVVYEDGMHATAAATPPPPRDEAPQLQRVNT